MTNGIHLTPEQRAEVARAKNVKNTLEWKLLQDSVGSNLVRNEQGAYGTFGVQAAEETYKQTMHGEDGQKEKSKLYEQKEQEGKQLGVFGEPTVTNYDLSIKLAKQLEEVMSMAKLYELEEHAKNIVSNLEFEVPEELKNYSKAELIDKVIRGSGDDFDGILDSSKLDATLNETEKDAFMMYQTLSELYKRGCAVNASQANYFADLSEQGKSIVEKYKKEE